MKQFVLVTVFLLSTGCSGLVSHETPSGQPPLATLDFANFKQQFNAAPGERLLLLLSPT